VARPPGPGVGGGGNGTPTGGGSKKIHPHLALVQIFRYPHAQHPAHLQPSPLCAHPFVTANSEDSDGLMCISPLHYLLADNPSRSPGAAQRSSPTKPRQQTASQRDSTNAKSLSQVGTIWLVCLFIFLCDPVLKCRKRKYISCNINSCVVDGGLE
jgi:hypothetical protein